MRTGLVTVNDINNEYMFDYTKKIEGALEIALGVLKVYSTLAGGVIRFNGEFIKDDFGSMAAETINKIKEIINITKNK